MSQNTVADGLNMVMNAIRARKSEVVLHRYSRILLSILAIAQLKGYIKEYKVDQEKNTVKVIMGNMNACGSISPRYAVQTDEIENFVQRYLPAKNIGVIIVSTSQGLMTHQTAQEKNIGGSLVAYIY